MILHYHVLFSYRIWIFLVSKYPFLLPFEHGIGMVPHPHRRGWVALNLSSDQKKAVEQEGNTSSLPTNIINFSRNCPETSITSGADLMPIEIKNKETSPLWTGHWKPHAQRTTSKKQFTDSSKPFSSFPIHI